MSTNDQGVYQFQGWAVAGDSNVPAETATSEVSTIRDGMAVSRVVGSKPEKFILSPGHRLVVLRGTLMLSFGLGRTEIVKVGGVFDPMQYDAYFIGGCTNPGQKISGVVGR